MKKIGKSLFVSFLFSFLVLLSFKSEAQVVIKAALNLEGQEVAVGDPFEVIVSVISKQKVDSSTPRPPDLDGFVLQGQNQTSSSSHRMVSTPQGMDWQTQIETNYIYVLTATRTGQLSIGSYEIVVDGKTYRTQPLLVKVLPEGSAGSGRPGRQPRHGGSPFGGGAGEDDPFEAMEKAEEEMFNQLLQRRQNTYRQADPKIRTMPVNPNEAFFIQVEADKNEVYEGEQITVSWYIYTRGQIESLDRTKFPDLRGFWKEIVEEVPAIQFQEEIINGIPYRKALLATHALFPLKAGNSVIDEFKIKAKVRLPRGGNFFALGPLYEYTKSSKPISIKVNPLPTEGRPKDFSGAVGQFQVSSRVDQNSVSANQPFSVRIRFEGQGNAKGIELPSIQWPQSFEVYDTKSDSKFFKNGQSFKEFEVLVIPRQVGDFEVPGFSVSMFDPAQKKYVTQQTQKLPIKVVQGAQANGTSQRIDSQNSNANAATSKVKPLTLPDVIKSEDFGGSHAQVMSPTAFMSGTYLLIFLGLLGFSKKEFGWGAKKRDLKKIVLKKMKTIEADVKKNDLRKVGVGMTNLFSSVLGEISGTGGSEEVHRLIEKVPPSLRNEYGAQLLKKFELFQTLGFAPDEVVASLKSQDILKKEFKDSTDLILKIVSSYDPLNSERES